MRPVWLAFSIAAVALAVHGALPLDVVAQSPERDAPGQPPGVIFTQTWTAGYRGCGIKQGERLVCSSAWVRLPRATEPKDPTVTLIYKWDHSGQESTIEVRYQPAADGRNYPRAQIGVRYPYPYDLRNINVNVRDAANPGNYCGALDTGGTNTTCLPHLRIEGFSRGEDSQTTLDPAHRSKFVWATVQNENSSEEREFQIEAWYTPNARPWLGFRP